jgi:hypothetical protein
MSKVIRQEHTKENPVDTSDIDFTKADNLTDDEINKGANNDPDALPLSEEDIKHIKIKRRGAKNV